VLCALTVRQLKPGTLDELLRSQDEHGYEDRRSAADAFVEDTPVSGVFEVAIEMNAE
jgi:hypothetical protein